MGEFLSFKKLISTALIKVLYVIGVVIITIVGLVMMFGGMGSEYDSAGLSFLQGLGILVLGNLAWRLICEGAILLFALFEEVRSINEKLNK